MNVLDKKYWESRYINDSTGWDLGHVSIPIKEYIDQLKRKDLKILIPGAGNSYEAEYLVRKGFKNVTVLDIAIHPLENIKKRLSKTPSLKYVNENFFDHQGSYDLILEQTFLCALELRFRESYFKKASQLLHTKGKIAGVLFNFTDQRTDPPFGGSIQEYERLCKSSFNIHTMDECYKSEANRAGKELFIILEKL